MVKQDWQYLAERLESVGQGMCLEAALVVREVLAVDDDTMEDPELEHAACSSVGHFVSTALDREDFDACHLPDVRALETEMTGHILNYRLQRGWLTRAPGAPVDFSSFADLIRK
ncbi:hypothetical protein D3C85_98680 [compost metagenome]